MVDVTDSKHALLAIATVVERRALRITSGAAVLKYESTFPPPARDYT